MLVHRPLRARLHVDPLHSRLHVDPYVQGFHIGRLKFEVYFELIYACATEKAMAEDNPLATSQHV